MKDLRHGNGGRIEGGDLASAPEPGRHTLVEKRYKSSTAENAPEPTADAQQPATAAEAHDTAPDSDGQRLPSTVAILAGPHVANQTASGTSNAHPTRGTSKIAMALAAAGRSAKQASLTPAPKAAPTRDGATVQRAPATSAAPASGAGGSGPAVTPPLAGIDKPGFIDHSDGANIRTGPAEAGGKPVRDQPLPPATRVFVSGTHPSAPAWWYVTAFLDQAMVRGYVQDLRVNTELPEPTAKLHTVVGGDTAEKLAAHEYKSSVRDGHDLRYYENVLLYVNQHDKTPRAGIAGKPQDPGILGGGSNNIQLFAGHRIWLVSPAYAKALEGVVPDGSLTGGAVAKAKRFAGHLQDILHSVTESPHHFAEVAGEYAQAIRDHMAEIVGVTAGFIMAEALSMFLAATPTGVGQIAAVLIQLCLALFGARGMVEAGIEALKHGSEWLNIAWTAKGDPAQIAAASKEFLKMLVSIAMAALAYLGVKGNVGNAVRIASSMPTGGLPALAVETGRRIGGAPAGAGALSGPGIGPFGPAGATGAMMTKHEGEGGGSDPAEASKAEKPATPKEAKADAAPEHAADKRDAKPKKPGAAANEVAEGMGRGLPECPVAKATIKPEVIDTDPRALEYVIEGKTATGKRVDFGSVELELTPQGDPAAPPIMSLGASAFVDGTEYAARIYEEVVSSPGGRPVGRGPRISLTRYAMDSFGRFYQGRFGYPLKAWGGRLAFENKLNFQREYVRLIAAGMRGDEAIVAAAKRISFGRHRIEAGFTKFSVRTNDPVAVDLGEGYGIKKVPTEIEILAEQP